MAPALLIIADDLTGAADTAAQFAKQGIGAAVSLSPHPALRSADPAFPVLAVDTESRHLPPADAFRRVVMLIKEAVASGVRQYYKKIDSTFRGNAGAELEALMLGCRALRLMLVPAYPKGGRTTIGGRQYVQGKPLEETFFARDPVEQMTESDISAILHTQTSFPTYLIPRGPELERRFDAEKGNGIFIFDAQTDEDLIAIGALLGKKHALDAVAGAAGFAELLPGLCGLPASRPPLPVPDFGPLLVVNGSLNELSLGQVAAARDDGIPCHTISPGAAEAAGSVARDLARTGCAIVTTALSADCPHEPPGDECVREAASLTAVVASLVPRMTVAVFGGDTAYSVCRALGITELFPIGEIMPGLTVSSVREEKIGSVILKSGGFGPRDVIRRIRRFIREDTVSDSARGEQPG